MHTVTVLETVETRFFSRLPWDTGLGAIQPTLRTLTLGLAHTNVLDTVAGMPAGGAERRVQECS